MLVMEDLLGGWLETRAEPSELRRRNFYSQGQEPLLPVVRQHDRLVTAWNQVVTDAEIETRQAAVAELTATNTSNAQSR